MTLQDTRIPWTVAGIVRNVVITGSALHVLWGADSGMQTTKGLLEANATMLRVIAKGLAQAGAGVIIIDDFVLEG